VTLDVTFLPDLIKIIQFYENMFEG